MIARNPLRWGGPTIIFAAVLMSSACVAISVGFHTTITQAMYSFGLIGLALSCTVIYLAQARQAGLFGLLAYLLAVLSLVYANVAAFLILAERAGFQAGQATLTAIWDAVPVVRIAVFSVFPGLALLGLVIARAGVFPKWTGILITLGAVFQIPMPFSSDSAMSLFSFLAIGGSVLLSFGLVGIGWMLWSGRRVAEAYVPRSPLDQRWGGPYMILTGLLFSLNAIVNNLGALSLLDGVSHLLMYTSLVFASPIWHAAQMNRGGQAGFIGFILVHLGAMLSVIPAFLIVAQLAGVIPTNDALMISWVDIPVGRAGNYMVWAGLFLLGLSTARTNNLPSWTGWLIVAGMAVLLPTYFVEQPYLFQIFWAVGATLVGVGMARIGWHVLRPA